MGCFPVVQPLFKWKQHHLWSEAAPYLVPLGNSGTSGALKSDAPSPPPPTNIVLKHWDLGWKRTGQDVCGEEYTQQGSTYFL